MHFKEVKPIHAGLKTTKIKHLITVMKKKILTLSLILAVSPFLIQCASQGDVNKLNYQLRIVNKKLEDMKMGTVDKMQQRQAASSSQIDDLRNEILVLKGELEELGHYNRQLKEQNKELEQTFQQYSSSMQEELQKERQQLIAEKQAKDAKMSELESRLIQQQETMRTIQQARIKEAERKARAAAQAAEKARAKASATQSALASGGSQPLVNITADKKKIRNSASKQSVSTASTKPKTTSNTANSTTVKIPANDIIQKADKEYANGNFKKAYGLYESYTQKNSGGDKAVTASFMMGECLFFQNEFDQAILQYQKIISNNPQHPRAASALLKQGMSFEKLSDFETAKIIYKKIGTSYSSSPEADVAKERSAKL